MANNTMHPANAQNRIATLERKLKDMHTWSWRTLKKVNAYDSFIETMLIEHPEWRERWDKLNDVLDED